MTRTGDLREHATELLAAVRRNELGFMAAAIAYYAFVTAVPLVLLGLLLATAVGGDALASELVAGLRGLLSREAAGVLESAMTSSSGRGEATAISLVVLSWSGLRLFRGLETAFARIYGRETDRSLLGTLVRAGVAFLAIGVGTLATVALAVALPLGRLPAAGLFGALFVAATLSVLFLPLYVVLPARNLGVRETVPGAVLAGTCFSLLGTLFGLYAGTAGGFELYGVLGGVLLLLTFLYAGGMVVILGAVLNATLARGSG